MNLNLKNKRQAASIASGGISSQPIYDNFLELIEDLNIQGDCLDFGAGIGNLTQLLQSRDCFNSITAADIMQRPVGIDDSIKWISWDLNESLDILSQQFDVIVSAEVIEHLENPRATTREWFRLLRPNGIIIFSTPNNESWRALIALLLQGHFVLFSDTCYPAHITALLRKDIRRILGEVGFSEPTFVFTNLGGIPKLPQFKWQQISGGLLKGLRYSDNLLTIAYKL
ncbi:class I SAM-dependent methyltransferase [Nostoc sp.]|uniref:class I SAM-dependent methyltransferase n=1 Tax=Nostoc sp. TaxID=1180 RepID=UPI002FF8FC2C